MSSYNSIEKALEVLMVFETKQPEWGVRELSAHLGFSPATVQRTLCTLRAYGFVDQNPDTRQYHLGNIYFRFLDVLQASRTLTQVAPSLMKQLIFVTRETVYLNVLEGSEGLCIDKIESPQDLKAVMPIGNRSPLYAGASSKCLLAFSGSDFIEEYLKKTVFVPITENTIVDKSRLRLEVTAIKQNGYAESMGERSLGLGSISAPVFDHRGMVIAALGLEIPEIRFQDELHRQFCIKELLSSTKQFSIMMGYGR
jgi:DNA-binding IclR family transcriptional regulator